MARDTVLITGGAGYIGSHIVLACCSAGFDVVVLDDLSTGRRAMVPSGATFVEGDVGDPGLLDRIFGAHTVSAVLHLAGKIVVSDSVTAPLAYYKGNTCKTRTLLQACIDHRVRRFVFSSTAAVYGQPDKVPVNEQAATQPANPYGTSKLMSEWMLRDAAQAHDFRYVTLRYFNVAGADPQMRAGQTNPAATHLIKVACEVAVGKRRRMEVFGEDYDTPDGTCIRDFIHVSDLAGAHLGALSYLKEGGDSCTLNCGYGRGYSVRQVLDVLQDICGKRLAIEGAPRRVGDVAALIADASHLRQTFDWKPQFDDLQFIIKTALEWEASQTAGAK